MRSPTAAMIAPTTSSLRSAESESHHETGIGCVGGEMSGVRPFCGALFGLPFPREGCAALPFGFAFDFGEMNGILRGIFEV